MSLSSALSSAMSGLTAASRASGVVSENLANAMTPGYARRSLELTSSGAGIAGVTIVGVHRHADPGITAERRAADAEFGNAQALARFHSRFEALVGDPTASSSIGKRIADMESSLITAASHPDSAQRLAGVVQSAVALVDSLAAASDGVAQMRMQADSTIGIQVERLNDALNNVRKLNLRITSTQASGGEIASLMDQRQGLVDQINEIVPVNQVSRDHGQIALYTDGGAILLDGQAAKVGFTPTGIITPDMTLAGGGLSGLDINGVAVSARSIAGGSLAAQFEIRDELAVSAQADLDTMARDLIERFETPSLDPTTAPGDPGLFTDAGVAFDPLLETGLAGRLAVNPAVDPEQGGEVWRLRDGLGAAVPGLPGEARQLRAFSEVLTTARTPGSPTLGTGLKSAAGLASALMSRAAQNASFSEQALSFATAGKTEMTRIELEQGVDTDAEMQTLMVVEQAYAANARMISAIDDMMETLLRL